MLDDIRELKLRVIRQTANGRQRKILRYQAKRVNELVVLKLQCMIILSTQERKHETKTFNENFVRKFEFAVPGNVKLKLP